jgi:putative ABC transport system substrate-binding protein
MRRREFVTGAALFAVSPAAAQTRTEPPRLAIFSPFQPLAAMDEHSSNRYYRAIFNELRRLGHVEGQNLTIERFSREQNTASLAAAAAEVVRSNPDVVLAIGFPGFAELKAETTTIPIVAFTGDPVAAGLIPSLAHPGGNITGVSADPPEIWGKRIQLLREIFPAISKLAILGPLTFEKVYGPAIRAACAAARLPLVSALYDPTPSASVYRQAITAAAREGADAIMVSGAPDAFENRVLITDLIGQARMPAIYAEREFVEVGGLMAFTADFIELSERSARDIDAILRGRKPADIPYYQATKYDLTINLKAAEALSLTVSQLLLARADEVIQ